MRALTLILLLLLTTTATLADIEALRAAAGAAVAAGETDIAADKFREILLEVPNDGSVHYQLGIVLMDNDGNLDDAITHFRLARENGFQPLGVAFRLSRIFARTGRSIDALVELEKMADGGFGLLSLVEDQADYDGIRSNPRYVSAVDTIRAARFPCQADERHHAFDFWIGQWTVSQNGQFAGTNNIQPILGHCVVFEQWESANGSHGKSFNYYDPGRDHWRQIWISDGGTFIEFTGEARDGGIFYTAETINPADGSVTHHKFEFTVVGDGDVRQFWQTSTDGGDTWSTIWDGLYELQSGEGD